MGIEIIGLSKNFVASIGWLGCPFCGSEELSFQRFGGEVWINCEKCFMSGPPSEDDNEAYRAWNIRHSNAPVSGGDTPSAPVDCSADYHYTRSGASNPWLGCGPDPRKSTPNPSGQTRTASVRSPAPSCWHSGSGGSND